MTPKKEGYRMPAEWEPHDATWLSWPKNPLTFPAERIENVEEVYSQMVAALSTGETVKILVDDKDAERRAASKIEARGADMARVRFLPIKSADVWIRDYGPSFLLNGRKKAAVKWTFNAWGEKYDDLLYDNTAGEDVVRSTGVRVFRPGIVLEGGSIDVNGEGSVLTTEQCLLNKNRNPDLSREQIESYLEEYLGAPNVIWLRSGIEGDDTDGHIDDFARFVSPTKVVCAFSSGALNGQVLQTNWDILQRSRDQDGRPLEAVKLPMPQPIELPEEDRVLPASYANFYIGNKVVLVPVFDDAADKRALSILQDCFRDREVIPIYATDLIYGYGGIHCVTQQEPAGLP